MNSELYKFVNKANSLKTIYTAGPSSLLPSALENIQPCFGRNDKLYDYAEDYVLNFLSNLTSHKNVVRLQGSATLAIEIGLLNFCKGKILIISTGYYSDRLFTILNKIQSISDIDIKQIAYENLYSLENERFDWIVSCYVETSCGFKVDIDQIKNFAKNVNAKLFLDATASIGLESKNHLGDVICYSSCKGLFGLTGASFIAFNEESIYEPKSSHYLSINTHINKGVTGPYHTILSLFGIFKNYNIYQLRVKKWQSIFLETFKEHLVHPKKNQPILCTLLNRKLLYLEDNPIIYIPRSSNPGDIVCHIGQVHRNIDNINTKIVKSHFSI